MPLTERLQPGRRAHHHIEFDDLAAVVEPDQVNAFQLRRADARGKLECDVVAVDELAVIPEVLEHRRGGGKDAFSAVRSLAASAGGLCRRSRRSRASTSARTRWRDSSVQSATTAPSAAFEPANLVVVTDCALLLA